MPLRLPLRLPLILPLNLPLKLPLSLPLISCPKKSQQSPKVTTMYGEKVCVRLAFKVPETFDASRSTEDNYADDHAPFSDKFKFAALRAQTDQSYHRRYSLERQEFQDRFVHDLISGVRRTATPYLVFLV